MKKVNLVLLMIFITGNIYSQISDLKYIKDQIKLKRPCVLGIGLSSVNVLKSSNDSDYFENWYISSYDAPKDIFLNLNFYDQYHTNEDFREVIKEPKIYVNVFMSLILSRGFDCIMPYDTIVTRDTIILINKFIDNNKFIKYNKNDTLYTGAFTLKVEHIPFMKYNEIFELQGLYITHILFRISIDDLANNQSCISYYLHPLCTKHPQDISK